VPVRVWQWRQILLPAFLHPEEDDFMALFDDVNEFKAAVRSVLREELSRVNEALARGEINNRIDPTSQHYKDSHRALYELLVAIASATGAQPPEPPPPQQSSP
jgi:hypothetical protein